MIKDSYEDMVRTDNRIVLFLGALFAVFMLSMIYVSATSITDGLEAYYKLDETTGLIATDFSGNGNDGTMEGYTFNHGLIVGDVNTDNDVMNFDGDGDYIDTGISQEMLDNSFSLSAWVNKTNKGTSEVIISKNFHHPSLRISSTGKLYLGYAQNSDTVYAISSNSVPIGEWVHVTGVYNDSDNSLKVYINGVFEGSETTDGTFDSDTTNNFLIGKFRSNPLSYFNGSLDDVQIYNRALTSDEISAQYNAGRGSYALSGDGLVAQYSGRDYNATHILDTNPVVEGATENTTYGKRFDGTNNYISGIYEGGGQTDSQTISMWVKKFNNDNFPSTDQLKFLTNRYLWFGGKDSYFRFGTGSNTVITVNKASFPFNEWNLLVGTYDGTTMKFYINGQFINNLETTLSATSNPLNNIGYIGGQPIVNRYFNGSIDEVGVWSRALSEDEIQYLYESSPHAQTSFESEQVSGTTDQNITLTCKSINGCKTINYNIDGIGFNTIQTGNDRNDSNSLYDATERTRTLNGGPILEYTYTFPTRSFNGGIIHYYIDAINFSNEIQNATGYTSTYFYRVKFLDGTYLDSASANTNNPNYQAKTYAYAGSGKDINVVELWVQTSNNSITSVKNTSFNYIIGFEYNTNPYSFLFSGAGQHSISYFSTDFAGNNETIKTSNFTTYGNARFYFKDENTGSDLTGVQVNFNGVDYDSGETNYIDLNLTGISNTTYTINFEKTGYTTRTYQAEMNEFTDLNKTIILLPETLTTSKEITFKFFLPDKSTVVKDTYFEIISTQDNGATAYRTKTDSAGYATYTLDTNNNNYKMIFNYGGTDYNYGTISLTLNKPKNEANGAIIDENWGYILTGLGSSQNTNIPKTTTYQTLAIYSNTTTSYDLLVMTLDADYETRTYQLQERGNSNLTLQPYLVKTADSAQVTIKLVDYSNNGISEAQLDFYRTIGDDGKVLVASIITDAEGEATTPLLLYQTYQIEVTIGGEKISFGNNKYYLERNINQTPTIIAINIDSINIIEELEIYCNSIGEKIIVDTNIVCYWYLNKSGATLTFLKYVNGVLSSTSLQSASDGNVTFVLNSKGSEYSLIIQKAGIQIKQIDINYIDLSTDAGYKDINGGWGTSGINTASNEQQEIIFMMTFFLLIFLSIIIGFYTKLGAEIFYLGSIMIPLAIGFAGLTSYILAFMGIIWLILRISNQYYNHVE